MAEDEDKKRESRGPAGVLWAVVDFCWPFALAICAALILRAFVIEPFVVPTGSMLNTIQLNDIIWVQKVTLELGRGPEQGDIVTFENPVVEDETLVKRVIATEGQTVDLVDGAVVVDGEVLDEPYTEGRPSYPLDDVAPGLGTLTYPLTVPEGYVWVMGDNRTNSRDSRYFGPVERDAVFGNAMFVCWPLADAKWL